LVEKKGEVSQVKELSDSERIVEISRMISGENITAEATLFAKTLLNKST
jgi:DNA repair protein RecN (Recombination protein N)